MLVGRVVADQLRDHAQAAAVRLADEDAGVAQGAVGGVDVGVIGDVVAVVEQRRWVEGQQPDRRDAQVLEVVQLLRQTGEVADAVVVAVEEGADVDLVDDGVLVPEGVIAPQEEGATAPAHRLASRLISVLLYRGRSSPSGLDKVVEITLAADAALDPEDVGRQHPGVKFDEVPGARSRCSGRRPAGHGPGRARRASRPKSASGTSSQPA